VFALFFACFSVPWDPIDTVNITGLHLIAYTGLFVYAPRYMSDKTGGFFDVFYYFGAVTFICMGFVLFFIVRRQDRRMEFENFILLKEQEERNAQINKELLLAAKVNETLVPRSISTNFVDINVKYIPASYMSGDYARYHFVEKDLLLFIICDVTGHGVSSALLVNRLHTEFIRLVKREKDPESILKELNHFIVNEFMEVGMYVSAFCGLADLGKEELTYANYGHPSQYLYNGKGDSIRQIPSRTTLMGIIEEPELDPKEEIPLHRGDRIFLFTDGLLEVNGKKKEEYGAKRLEAFISENAALTPEDFNDKLLKDIDRFKQEEFQDDIFMINIMIKKTGSRHAGLDFSAEPGAGSADEGAQE
ncbi:MAG: serine/threonine-protein phosphatase, partial [Candidatus Omnitrophica bacterium]|nr:serine/threonine-protein phosphatase [Candidatus Omnitrophota bacterium]